jgi:hypothetical protein
LVAGSNPRDVLVIGDGTAFVSFFDSRRLPDNEPAQLGVRVFAAATGAQLTAAPTSTGLPPIE